VAPPGGRSHGETRLQRSISQPFVRVNVVQIRFPATVPATRAFCGPPYISVHAMLGGSGANSLAPPLARRRQATAFRGSDPRGGLQRSVHVTLAPVFALFSQYVTRSDVLRGVLAAASAQADRAAAAARTSTV
jgi:hypothetical protein